MSEPRRPNTPPANTGGRTRKVDDMIKGTSRIVSLLVAAVAAVLMACAPALADKLHLRDGRILEGKIESEGDGFVWFTVVVGQLTDTKIYTTDQILRIERDDDGLKAEKPSEAAGVPVPLVPPVRPAQEKTESASGATRVCFISLEEMVGPFLNADALRRSVEAARADNPDIIVLVIDSGGGALMEVQPLSDVIHNEMKKDFRVVAWIRSAISAASLTAFNCEELYMMSGASIGGTVAFVQTGPGQTQAASGRDLEQILELGEMISKRGRRDPLIMRAMQVFMDLSADIDENGRVTWYEGTKGKYLVNPKDRILTFNANDALKFGLSKGTADTKESLLQQMGVREWVEVAQRADRMMVEFRQSVAVTQTRAGEIMAKFNMAMQAAGGSRDRAERNMFIGRAQRYLDELQSLIRRAPSLETYTQFNREWFRERREELRKMAAENR
jgi:membrane-bound ClpP family serine protease